MDLTCLIFSLSHPVFTSVVTSVEKNVLKWKFRPHMLMDFYGRFCCFVLMKIEKSKQTEFFYNFDFQSWTKK